MTIDQLDGVDFALAAYREEGEWQLEEIASPYLEDVETLTTALRRFRVMPALSASWPSTRTSSCCCGSPARRCDCCCPT
ncbi:MAG: hypothetical protein R2731_09915 [Nocardioides sp.]